MSVNPFRCTNCKLQQPIQIILLRFWYIYQMWRQLEAFYVFVDILWVKVSDQDVEENARLGVPQDRIHQHRESWNCNNGNARIMKNRTIPIILVDLDMWNHLKIADKPGIVFSSIDMIISMTGLCGVEGSICIKDLWEQLHVISSKFTVSSSMATFSVGIILCRLW